MFRGRLIRESAKTTNDDEARAFEAKRRTELREEGDAARKLGCDGVVHCSDCQKWCDANRCLTESSGQKFCNSACLSAWKRKHAPTLREFSLRFLAWAETRFSAKPKTWLYYRNGTRRLLAYADIAGSRLDAITGELVTGYAAHRQADDIEISSVNRELQVLRRMLHLAVSWGIIERTAKVEMLPGERHRELVIQPHEEARYLAAAPEPLASVATVLADTGFRPEECHRLRWENIAWVNGRQGTLQVMNGKTAAARRTIPMTPRVRMLLESRWEAAGKPLEGWVWLAPMRSGHLEPSSLKKQHKKALRLSKVRPFVLYSFRHTFLTRLGESGCAAWTLARIAGHSSIGISSRYVHPSEDAVTTAFLRLGGHEISHTDVG
jgi:integrase